MGDVMWATDFLTLPDGRKLLATIDERARFHTGWEICRAETVETVLAHIRRLIAFWRRKPLVWKFDRGSAFRGGEVQALLASERITPFYTAPRAPWTNGRCERGNRDVRRWLEGATDDLDLEVNHGMGMLNFIKHRAVLGYRTAWATYRDEPSASDSPRNWLMGEFASAMLVTPRKGEAGRRWAIRSVLRRCRVLVETVSEPEAASTRSSPSRRASCAGLP